MRTFFKDAVMIKGRPFDRAVETITPPKNLDGLEVDHLRALVRLMIFWH